MADATSGRGESSRLIKRYGNRRLYDTVAHRYISRAELGDLARRGLRFEVRDARTGEDLTRITLMALLTEGSGPPLDALPLELLRDLASAQEEVVRQFFEVHLPAMFRAYSEMGEGFLRMMETSLAGESGADDRGDAGGGPAPAKRRGRRRKS